LGFRVTRIGVPQVTNDAAYEAEFKRIFLEKYLGVSDRDQITESMQLQFAIISMADTTILEKVYYRGLPDPSISEEVKSSRSDQGPDLQLKCSQNL
jgi:hypothetical protein